MFDRTPLTARTGRIPAPAGCRRRPASGPDDPRATRRALAPARIEPATG